MVVVFFYSTLDTDICTPAHVCRYIWPLVATANMKYIVGLDI